MRKITSLLLVFALAFSMVLSVSAADGSLSLPTLTTANIQTDANNSDGYYSVPITLANVYAYGDCAGNFQGYNTATLYVVYDSTKLTAGKKGARGTLYGESTAKLTMLDPSSGEATSSSSMSYSVQDVDKTHKRVCIIMKEGAGVIDGTDIGTGILTNIYFKPVTGATGVAELSFTDVAFGIYGTAMGISKHTDFTLNPGSIDLGGAATKYTVTASAGANGSIAEKDGKTEGATGDVLTYNITADTGYVIDTITVDGAADTSKAGQASATITYTVAEAAGTISVTFKAEETETTIATIGRYKDATALYTLGKVVVGTNGCTRYGVAVQSVKRGEEVYYSGSNKTAEGYYVVGFTGTAYDNNAATKAFADITDAASRIFGAEVSEYTAE